MNAPLSGSSWYVNFTLLPSARFFIHSSLIQHSPSGCTVEIMHALRLSESSWYGRWQIVAENKKAITFTIPLRVNECTALHRAKMRYQSARTVIRSFLLRLVINPEGRVRLDAPPACDPVSRQGMKTHDLSIPTNLC